MTKNILGNFKKITQKDKKMATTRSSYLENFSTAYSLVVNCLSKANI